MFWVKHPVSQHDSWIRVVDMMGRVIATVKVAAGTSFTQVKTAMLKTGYYKVGMHGAMLNTYKT